MKNFGVVLAVLLFGLSSHAVSSGQSNISTSPRPKTTQNSDSANLISLNAFQFLMSGFSLAYDRAVTEKISAGAFVSSWQKNGTESVASVGQDKVKVSNFGARGRYFVTGAANEKGFYLGGGASRAKVETSFRFSGGQEIAKDDSKMGGFGELGYLFEGRKIGQGNIAFNLGLYLGNGAGAEYKASTDGFGTNALETSVRSGVGFDASLGMAF